MAPSFDFVIGTTWIVSIHLDCVIVRLREPAIFSAEIQRFRKKPVIFVGYRPKSVGRFARADESRPQTYGNAPRGQTRAAVVRGDQRETVAVFRDGIRRGDARADVQSRSSVLGTISARFGLRRRQTESSRHDLVSTIIFVLRTPIRRIPGDFFVFRFFRIY